jgi:hypothetical protein
MESTYRAFGLTIGSELSLPGLPVSSDSPQIHIRRAVVPEWNGHARIRYAERCRIDGQKWWVHFKAVQFTGLIHDGKLIEFDADPAQDHISALHVLGSCTGALLFQRGLMPIHGNTVAGPQGTATIVGKIGAGKSATTFALMDRGYRLVADDISAFSFEGGTPRVMPGFPRLKLWKSTLEHFARDPDEFVRLRPELEKYHYPVEDAFCGEPQAPDAIYILHPAESPGVHIRPLSGVTKLEAMRAHLYKIRFRDAILNWPPLLNKICVLADKVSVNIVERPQAGTTIEAVAEAIHSHLAHLSSEGSARVSRDPASVA